MKLRTVENLQSVLDTDLTWRKRELLVLRELAVKAREHERPALLRSLLTMSYAHWEGYTKTSIESLLVYVKAQGLRHRQLNFSLLGMTLAPRVRQLAETQKYRPFGELFRYVTEVDDERCNLPTSISTRSNLSSAVFADLLGAIGLAKDEVMRAAPGMTDFDIDFRLVGRRNTIAHGEAMIPALEECVEVRDSVLGLLDLVRDCVLEYAIQRAFLRSDAKA